MKFLDPVALSKLGTLALKARTIAHGALAGLHRSPHHGSSVEFAEHKEYSPGDELKHMDWKAYGKFDRYYVKRFEQETELNVYLLLDRSGSMAYRGDGLSKLEYGAYVAASLAYLLIRQQDRVGLLAFGEPSRTVYVPPRARTTHLHDMLSVIERVVDEGGVGETGLVAALDRVAEMARKRRSVVIVVSDLFDPSPDVLVLLRRLRALRHDVVVFQTLDPHELELPFEGITLFQSLEDDRKLLADPRAIRTAYLRELHAFLERIKQGCTEGDVERHLIPTNQPLELTLGNFLTARLRGRGARAAGAGAA
jgi:uncharacterized protein (DUF58 family)